MRLSDVLAALRPVTPAAAAPASGPIAAGRPDTGDAAAIASQFARQMGEHLAGPSYWHLAGLHSYWRCVRDLCAAADRVGDDQLPDVPLPGPNTRADVLAALAGLEDFGRRVLAEATAARPRTPDRRTTLPDGTVRTTVTVQRACNGCGKLLGDVTDAEIDAAVAGAPLTDVRAECPNCRQHVATRPAQAGTEWSLQPGPDERVQPTLCGTGEPAGADTGLTRDTGQAAP